MGAGGDTKEETAAVMKQKSALHLRLLNVKRVFGKKSVRSTAARVSADRDAGGFARPKRNRDLFTTRLRDSQRHR